MNGFKKTWYLLNPDYATYCPKHFTSVIIFNIMERFYYPHTNNDKTDAQGD